MVEKLKNKIIGKINRQLTETQDARDEYDGFDDIVNLVVEPIPTLSEEPTYSQYVETIGRDIVQQVVNIYSTQTPKLDVIPFGLGDVDHAEKVERVLEWALWQANQMGKTPYISQLLLDAAIYNRSCAQLEYSKDYGYCVKRHHPGTVVGEQGYNKMLWGAAVNNIFAAELIERWTEWEEEHASVKSAIRKLDALLEEDEEARVVYIDYEDSKQRYVCYYPVADKTMPTEVDADADVVVILDTPNKKGYVNWAIKEGEGDPLLAPLLRAGYYKEINDLVTIQQTILYKRAFYPMFLQNGPANQTMTVDMSGDTVVAKAPSGSQVVPLIPPPLDPGFSQRIAELRYQMINSLGIGQTASLQISNVQHSTLQEQIKLRLAQTEPAKRIVEGVNEGIARLILQHAKKNGGYVGVRMNGSGGDKMRGMELALTPDEIDSNIYVKCEILASPEHNMMELANIASIFKNADIPIDMDELVERFGMGSPDAHRQAWEKRKLETAVLEGKVQTILGKAQMQIQVATQEQLAQIQVQAQQAMAAQAQAPQAPAGNVAPEGGSPLPSDAATSGQGFDAAQGGTAPQAAVPSITQAGR